MAALGVKIALAFRWLRDTAAKLLEVETYSKSFVFKILIGLLALVFWNLLVSFYQNILVQPVLSKVTSDGPRNLAFGLAIGLLLLLLIAQIRRAYRPGPVQFFLFVVPSLLYLFTRDGEQWGCRWHFVHFQGAHWLYYADILILPLLSAIMLPLVAYRRMQLPAPVLVNSYLQEDTSLPLNVSERRDTRDSEAQRLMEQLNALRPRTAFAVGIVGQWGSGKTRFLQLMQQHLPADAIFIQFNPWLVESTAAIRKEFFTTLKDCLGKYSGELATELGTYANGLAEVADSTSAKAFKEVVSFLSDQPTLTEQFDKVNKVIGHLNRPIYIFLDDIDRLDKDEVLETLRIVRNTANFRRTVFVLAYDRAYVLEAVQRTNQANSGQYLDKIVQLEFLLPSFSAAALAERTLEVVLPHVPKKYHAELTDLVSQRANQRPARNFFEQLDEVTKKEANRICYYPELITTMRGAVRLGSLFIHDFLPLAGEVRLDEFLNLTLLKLRFPALYEALKTQRVVEPDNAFNKGGTVMRLNEEYLEDFFVVSTASLYERQLAARIVRHLFAKDKLTSSERTIQRPSAFDLYFLAGNFTGVSLTGIEQLRLGSSADIDSYINQWQQADQLTEAMDVLKDIRLFNNRQDFENVVAAVLEIGRRLGQDVSHWLLVINAQSDELAKRFYAGQKGEMAAWFTRLLANAPAPQLFEANLIKDLQLESRSTSLSEFWVSQNALNNLALRYLMEHLSTHPQVDQDAFRLHWGTAYDVDKENRVLTGGRANLVMKEALQADPLGAIPALLVPVNRSSNTQYYAFQPLLPRIFDSWDNVQKFLQQMPSSPEAQRIQQDFKLFQASGYRDFSRA